VTGTTREEVTGGCRKPHEELCNLHPSPDIAGVNKSRTVRIYSTHRGNDKCVKHFGGKNSSEESRGRPRHRWKNNIKVGLRRKGVWTGFVWLIVPSLELLRSQK
jgi:hypothetical protein